MKHHIVIDGNAFYEIDEECLKKMQLMQAQKERVKPPKQRNRQTNLSRDRKKPGI